MQVRTRGTVHTQKQKNKQGNDCSPQVSQVSQCKLISKTNLVKMIGSNDYGSIEPQSSISYEQAQREKQNKDRNNHTMTIPNNSELKRNKEDLNLSPIPAQDQLIKVEQQVRYNAHPRARTYNQVGLAESVTYFNNRGSMQSESRRNTLLHGARSLKTSNSFKQLLLSSSLENNNDCTKSSLEKNFHTRKDKETMRQSKSVKKNADMRQSKKVMLQSKHLMLQSKNLMLESNDLRQSNDRARLGSMVFTSLGRKSELIGSANQPRHFSPLRQSRAELHLAVQDKWQQIQCLNNDAKMAKYKIVQSQEDFEILHYCSSCAIALIKQGFQVVEMTQRDFHQLQNQRRETVINEYYYTNSTRKTNSEWHTNGERIKQQLYQQLNKLKVGKEHYEDYFERNEKAIQQYYNNLTQQLEKQKLSDLQALTALKLKKQAKPEEYQRKLFEAAHSLELLLQKSTPISSKLSQQINILTQDPTEYPQKMAQMQPVQGYQNAEFIFMDLLKETVKIDFQPTTIEEMMLSQSKAVEHLVSPTSSLLSFEKALERKSKIMDPAIPFTKMRDLTYRQCFSASTTLPVPQSDFVETNFETEDLEESFDSSSICKDSRHRGESTEMEKSSSGKDTTIAIPKLIEESAFRNLFPDDDEHTQSPVFKSL